jgi:hypothetical protein
MTMAETPPHNFGVRAGDTTTYYWRSGKPGREVTILEVRPHVWHHAMIRFRYADGREREVSALKFFARPK